MVRTVYKMLKYLHLKLIIAKTTRFGFVYSVLNVESHMRKIGKANLHLSRCEQFAFNYFFFFFFSDFTYIIWFKLDVLDGYSLFLSHFFLIEMCTCVAWPALCLSYYYRKHATRKCFRWEFYGACNASMWK